MSSLSMFGDVINALQPILNWALPITLGSVVLYFIRSFFK